MRLALQVALILAIPLLGLLTQSVAGLTEKRHAVSELQAFQDIAKLTVVTGTLATEMQKERGMTRSFATSGGHLFSVELPVQRKATDAASVNFTDAAKGADLSRLPSSFRDRLKTALGALEGLAAHRRDVDGLTLTPPQTSVYYTAAIKSLIDIVPTAAALTNDSGLFSQLHAYHLFLLARESAGQERAIGAEGFATGRFSLELLTRFLTAQAEQSADLTAFLSLATEAQREALAGVVKDQPFATVDSMRLVALESLGSGSVKGIASTDWFDAATKRLGLLHEVEAKVAADLISLARSREEDVSAAFYRELGLALLLTFIAVTVGLVLSRQITGRLRRLSAVMSKLSLGALDVVIADTELSNEIGAMARSVQVFREAMIESDRLRAQQEIDRVEAERQKGQALATMAERVETETRAAVERVARQTGAMAGNATSMAGSAELVGTNSQNVASAATQALANAQTVASATEELTSSISEISAQIGTAARLTSGAVETAHRAQETISQLSTAVGRIGEVANLINDIASQTNLLALNATIEAARAGEAGKGFAVVANEVKSLASQTARATGDIATQIAEVKGWTESAVAAVGEIGRAINEVEGVSTAVAGAVEQQSAATDEIARNVLETSNAAEEVARRIQTVSEEARATRDKALQVSAVSDLVAQSIEELREVLVRVVRTSTTEVNRREHPRFQLGRRGTVSFGGKSIAVTVENMSEGGLMGSGLSETIPPGTRVTLAVEGITGQMTAVALAVEKGRMHGKFELDASGEARWLGEFRALVRGQTPLNDAA
jgi:methyl-accepting chemotaxis protein